MNNLVLPQEVENDRMEVKIEMVEDVDIKFENFQHSIEVKTETTINNGDDTNVIEDMGMELESLHHFFDMKDDTSVNRYQSDNETQICDEVKCGVCNEIFTNILQLTKHNVLIHGDAVPLLCSVCGGTFRCAHQHEGCRNVSNQTENFRTHTSDKPFDCAICRPASEDSEPVTVRNCKDIVDYLVNILNFDRLSDKDKLYIKQLNRPCPDLSKILINLGYGKQNRTYNNAWYQKHTWIAGSASLKKIFCWPCVLFANQSNSETLWSKTGYADLRNLSRATDKHSKSCVHICCNCQFILFSKENISPVVTSSDRAEIESFNIGIRENRNVMKKLVDIALYFCTQELPFNHDSFEELVSLFSKQDIFLNSFLAKHSDTNSVFFGTLKTAPNDLIDSINLVLNKKIDEEILSSPFISWQIDEITDINSSPKLSAIFRYVISGKIVERFMGFFDIGPGRTANDLFELLTTRFDKYDLKTKLVGQTYDGAVVVPGELDRLQAKIKTVAPRAIFTHSHAHALNSDMAQACSRIHEVNEFFAILSGFSEFFSKSKKRTNILEEICGNLPWNFTCPAVLIVNTYREKLIQIFDFITDSADFEEEAIRAAVTLKSSLNDHNFIFFLETFTLIFEQTDEIFSILQNKLSDLILARKCLQSLMAKLREFRSSDEIFTNIYNKLDIDETAKRRKNNELPFDKKQQLEQIFFEILDIIINQIEVRFCDTEKLKFFDLLEVSKFSHYKNLTNQVLSDCVADRLQQYTFFDREQLKTELSVVYSDELLGESKTPIEMIRFVHDTGLNQCMPEFYKLLCLAVILPVIPASVERSLSTLNRIKNYNDSAIGRNRSNDVLTQIVIEKDLVKICSGSDQFLEDIVDCFSQQKNCKIPLVYKEL